ncbi:hypothetical protein [Salinactinospora qingdaonensis]|uniref:Uncharacterized protein n=1 Tax=Salinactinospora qingdaonensis TaxID=702744 RepID=A0ABP7FAX1_9ACTN
MGGKHENPDTPEDGGSGGSAGTDGDKPNKHGSEDFPTPSGDGTAPGK